MEEALRWLVRAHNYIIAPEFRHFATVYIPPLAGLCAFCFLFLVLSLDRSPSRPDFEGKFVGAFIFGIAFAFAGLMAWPALFLAVTWSGFVLSLLIYYFLGK